MTNRENRDKNVVTMMHPSFIASKPAVPSVSEQSKAVIKSADPSSCLRNNRYPVPSFFEQRVQMAD